jgi:hypothetical protein
MEAEAPELLKEELNMNTKLKTGWETAEKKMEANKEQSKLSKKFQ